MPNEALSVIGLFFKFTIVKMQRTIINDLIIKKKKKKSANAEFTIAT